ncbi:4-hydroxybenzoate octaprenyltransferase [uncultured Rubinisphaera sp.]|uniref:4-hydroxybenzoate octaprenyltransferase n=1 Tax=uncultured Rubinisphaera sp. TaxID=1678686 RepID=UPI0030D97EA5
MTTAETTPTSTFKNYLGLIRFSHTIFALPFALLSAAIAWVTQVEFRLQDLCGILLCMVFARTAAMAFNRYADRKLDAENPRTKGRHIPAGILSARQVLGLTIFSGLAFIASTLLFFPNQTPLILSVPVLLFLLGYSYVKRFSMWAHYWLAAALMLSPIATWIALTGTVDPSLWWLAAAIFFWVGGFDIIYACQDAEFDRKAGLFSIPARIGISKALKLAAISHFLCAIALILFAWTSPLSWLFLASVIVVALLLIYEHAIVTPQDLSRAGIAFFNINAIISIGLFLFGIADLWLTR